MAAEDNSTPNPSRSAGAQAYEKILLNMEQSLLHFQAYVPAPEIVPFRDSFVYRYTEKSIEQAIIQKLARIVSALCASKQLFSTGLFQELGAIQRILDELNEDTAFLCLAVVDGTTSDLHTKYLDDFYLEEFDAENLSAPSPKRSMLPRKKIRAYLANHETTSVPNSRAVLLFEKISKTYSGFVHAASPHVMDMFDGSKFLVGGMRGTHRERECADDLWNYFYRSMLTFALTAKAFGDVDHFECIRDFAKNFEQISGEIRSNE